MFGVWGYDNEPPMPRDRAASKFRFQSLSAPPIPPSPQFLYFFFFFSFCYFLLCLKKKARCMYVELICLWGTSVDWDGKIINLPLFFDLLVYFLFVFFVVGYLNCCNNKCCFFCFCVCFWIFVGSVFCWEFCLLNENILSILSYFFFFFYLFL